jgi:polysaccharide export outer membrane protein
MSLSRNLVVLSCFVVAVVSFFEPRVSQGETLKTIQSYRIGAGDVLKIGVWKEPDISLEASMVRTDGQITFPLLDDIQASGFTTMELKAVIEKRLSEFVESPQVTVTLINPGSQRYYILGEVNSTGEYPIIKNLTILQAFAIAKGFTEWASKKEIILFRHEGEKERIIRVNYKDIVKGDFSNNISIKADDTIIVP